ncbi:MAG: energy transducer TonB [Pyrinomonadaceae bacterium]
MKLASFITKLIGKKAKVKAQDRGVAGTLYFFLPFAFLVFTFASFAQRVAILTPDGAESSRAFAAGLAEALSDKTRILDDGLSEAAFDAAQAATPFNLTKEDSKRIGSVIGCEYFLLIRSATLRRSSSQRPEYYEANAAIYVVSSRTGRLVLWRLLRFEAGKSKDADTSLAGSIGPLAAEIIDKTRSATKGELAESAPPEMEEVPDANSPAAKSFRAPIPYRRFKPDYTADAALYDVTATVDVEVDLDAAGAIKRTEIVRWAGYGLDESVEKTVRQMNWRPAERSGKTLPMRFLLRYNFKKVDKDEVKNPR